MAISHYFLVRLHLVPASRAGGFRQRRGSGKQVVSKPDVEQPSPMLSCCCSHIEVSQREVYVKHRREDELSGCIGKVEPCLVK